MMEMGGVMIAVMAVMMVVMMSGMVGGAWAFIRRRRNRTDR
jgi:hypothetical protein